MSAETPSPPLRHVIVCDETGRPTGTAEIIAAHTGAGKLHLAFSVYVFSPDRRSLLIQQRSGEKLLWPLIWANTCCSHPREGEDFIVAAQRRLREEMGLTCDLSRGPEFVYRAVDQQGRGVEHEFDVILLGTHYANPVPDPAEVADWKWADLGELQRDMRDRPDMYAPWFHLGLPRALGFVRTQPPAKSGGAQ
jgi:isopentenyl-diphosphate Delta-isomerase